MGSALSGLFKRKPEPKPEPELWPPHEWVPISGGVVVVQRIRGNGDCLFASIIHQLTTTLNFRDPPTVAELRKKVSKFLTLVKNDDHFANTIKATAEQDPDLQKYRTNRKTLVDKFIDRLAKTKCFAGGETIQAISQLYQVSIHLYNERDRDFVVGEYPQRIRICYRLTRSNQEKRLHYDSVVGVQMKTDQVAPVVETSSLQFYMEQLFKFKDYITQVCPALKMVFDLARFAVITAGDWYKDYSREFREVLI